MPYAVNSKRSQRKARRKLDIIQNKFPKGYISTIDNSRRPIDSFSDLTNMEIVQDNLPRPRPPLVRYGTQPDNTVIGRGNYNSGGVRGLLFMQNVAGTGQIFKQTDGGSFSNLGGSYDEEAWAGFVQAQGKAFPFNGINNLSYVDLSDDSIHTYVALSTPGAPTPVKTGMSGSTFTHYYAITALNDVGESIASTAGTTTSGKVRESWIDGTDLMTVTWSAVTDATAYTIYYGSSADTLQELYTVSGNGTNSFTDYGTLATNPYKLAPQGNSTQGFVATWMYVDAKNSQIFGISTDNKLYYSAPGTTDFSPFNGGGWVAIDDQGDTTLNYVTGFRNGKGDPVITVSARGAAGTGKLFHVSFEQLTVGDQIITFPNVYEANGQAGTYAPRATIKSRDSITYPTGVDFKDTGTSQNIVNILTTNRVDQVIEDDVDNLSLMHLHKAVGLGYKDRQYFALPVGSTENNEIWIRDNSRKGLWILRWPIAAKDMYLYEDNDGVTHFCVIVNNVILEFTRAGARTHQDDDVPWRSRVAFESLVWDEAGMSLAKLRNQYFKFLFPKGQINVNATGLTRLGGRNAVGDGSFSVTTTATGWGAQMWGQNMWGADPGTINSYGQSVAVIPLKPKGLLAEESWEVVCDTAGTDYILSVVQTKGFALDDLTLKTRTT